MADNVVIKVDKLDKTFRLPLEKNSTVKSAVVNFWRQQKGYEEQHALKNISFEVKDGEFFGIVGRNGSGKSTLLKILAGIYQPTSGSVSVAGKLTPFIELGVGFNMELTGRENVYLNGALLGFSRAEMEDLYEDIVSFAELERFMDQKLKNYSSGMQVRLAFSIAIRVNSDILLIDEVLAVGDANFQNKCINVFRELKAARKTILFISHDMGMVRRFCDRAIMIADGKFVAEGTPDEISELYEEANLPSEKERRSTKSLNKEMSVRTSKIITELKLSNKTGKEVQTFEAGQTATLSIKLKKDSPAENIGVAVYTRDNQYVFGTNTINDKVAIKGTVKYNFKVNLGEGEYKLKIGVFGKNDKVIHEFFEHGPTFFVRSDEQNKAGWQGTTYLDHDWQS